MKSLLFILPLLMLFSCGVQKRKYQKGFYVSSTKHSSQIQKEKSSVSQKESENLVLKTVLPLQSHNYNLEFSASANQKTNLFLNPSSLVKIINPDSICDIITLKNGDDIKVTIFEISPVLIKYKKCNTPDGPLYIVKKTDVFMIKYANGTKEVIGTETNNTVPENNTPSENSNTNYRQQFHPLAIWALVSLILGFFTFGIGFIIAFFLANQAIKKILENPKLFKGYRLARTVKLIIIRLIFFLISFVLLGLIFSI